MKKVLVMMMLGSMAGYGQNEDQGLACSAFVEKLSLTEQLYTSTKWTIFTCRLLYSESNPKTREIFINAIITEVFSGSADRDTVILYRQGGSEELFYPPGSKPKDTLLRTYEKGEPTILFYANGKGHKFNYDGTGFRYVDKNPEIQNELNLLRQFASIFKNKKSGTFTFYNSSNKVLAKGKYKNGIATGFWKHYNDNGTIKSERDIEGRMTKTNSETGIPLTFSKVYKDSSVSILYNDGIPYSKHLTIYSDTVYISEVTEYGSNGRIQKILTVLKTKSKDKDSKWVVQPQRYQQYYGNGNLKTDGFYVNEKLVGLWKFYNEDGSFDYEYDCK